MARVPAEVLQANPAFLDDDAEKRRAGIRRPPTAACPQRLFGAEANGSNPFMETFDLPETSVSCHRRDVSTVAPQALSLLNSSLTIAAAKGLAERVARSPGDDTEKQVETTFQLALNRSPGNEERAAAAQLYEPQLDGVVPRAVKCERVHLH